MLEGGNQGRLLRPRGTPAATPVRIVLPRGILVGVSRNEIDGVFRSIFFMEFFVVCEAPGFSNFPRMPGVYAFRDRDGNVLYVGKSKNLRARLQSHFRDKGGEARKKSALRNLAFTVAAKATSSHFAAVLHEIEVIHALRPRLNQEYARPERYAYLAVDFRQPYPRLDLRHHVEAGPRYFGPVLLPRRLSIALEEVADAFALRTCGEPLPGAAQGQACWRYQVKTCVAPCQGNVSAGRYGRHLLRALRVLTGNNETFRQWKKSLLQKNTDHNPQSRERLRRRIAAVDRARRMLLLSRYQGDDAIVVQRCSNGRELEAWAIRRGDVALQLTIGWRDWPDKWFPRLWNVYSIPEEPATFVPKKDIDRRWAIYHWLRSKEGRSSAVFVRGREEEEVWWDLQSLVRG